MEDHPKVTRFLHRSSIYIGITVIVCGLAASAACARNSNTTSGSSKSVTTTLANTAALDTSNPEVQRKARKLAREPAVPTAGRPSHRRGPFRSQATRQSLSLCTTLSGPQNGERTSVRPEGPRGGQQIPPARNGSKVTNLQNGRTAVVTVEDHGPYVNGRAVDVTSATARQLGITKRQGIVPVVVAPVAIPQSNGTVTAGAGAVPGPATAN